jgi:hypothetical protein
MKTLLFSCSVVATLALAALPGCAPRTAASRDGAAVTTSQPPTAATVDADTALREMHKNAGVSSDWVKDATKPVDLSTLSPQLRTRFTNAKAALEDFAFRHTDQGDDGSGVAYVLSSPNGSEFVGFVVYAEGGDDADHYSASAAAYYTTTGGILDVQTRAAGISDSEDAGDWSNVDDNVIAAQERVLRTAFKYDAEKQEVSLDKSKTTKASIDGLPFATLVNAVKTEIESSTLAHSDLGDDATRFVSVKDANGSVAGYILESDGGDDADRWFSAAYALFSATGQLLDRQISTGGLADTMDDDSVTLTPQNQP